MRKYILTESERNIIKHYLHTGEKLDGFKVLLHRAKNQDSEALIEDLKLICKLLIKNGAVADSTSSNGDFELVLMQLFCSAADELSEFQDRAANEAFVGTARKRKHSRKKKSTKPKK
jgi:hypothetical protein